MKAFAAFAGGYTAGHLTPGFAVAAALKRQDPAVGSIFIGSEVGPEQQMVENEGIPFFAVPSYPFARPGIRHKLRGVLSIPGSFLRARRILRSQSVQRLILLGGHASVGPALAALWLSIPIFIVEPNARFGMANRIFARLSKAIFVGYLFNDPVSPAILRKVECTGVPVRKEIEALHRIQRHPPPVDKPVRLLILGGSLGHRMMNSHMPRICDLLTSNGSNLEIEHQCGVREDVLKLHQIYERHGVAVTIHDYVTDIHNLYERADIAVTAAGAITLNELACAGLPSVVVPLEDAAAAHQNDNADTFEKLTGSPVMFESELSGDRLTDYFSAMIRDRSDWTDRIGRMYGAARLEAADTIARILLDWDSPRFPSYPRKRDVLKGKPTSFSTPDSSDDYVEQRDGVATDSQ